jgi:phosphate transport system substrate-binding protein
MASDPSRWHLRAHVATALIAALVVLLASVLVLPGDRSATAQPVSDTLVFAGCDSNVPLTRLLARTFMQRHSDVRIQLKTVGSTNGVALAAAGAVQIGLVSRPLRGGEERLGLTFLPYATTAVIVGADPSAPDTTLAAADLLSFYRGTKLQWNSGREIALLTREEGDSSVASLKQAMPGFAEAYAAGSNRSHWTILYSEPAMHEALLMFPFAVGLSDLGTVTLERLPIRVLSIDGIAPTLENVVGGRYPFTKTLGFVWRQDGLSIAARAFVDFARSDEAVGILTSSGYLPVR